MHVLRRVCVAEIARRLPASVALQSNYSLRSAEEEEVAVNVVLLHYAIMELQEKVCRGGANNS